jgi:hypothetical protein
MKVTFDDKEKESLKRIDTIYIEQVWLTQYRGDTRIDYKREKDLPD